MAPHFVKKTFKFRDSESELPSGRVLLYRRPSAAGVGLLVLLGFLWSSRLVAIKAAGLSGIPAYVTITLSIFGISLLFTIVAIVRRSWPPRDRAAVTFYALNGVLGFVAPFILENLVGPRLPVFVFVVIISTMPVITLALVAVTGTERLRWVQGATVALGFGVAILTATDTIRATPSQPVSWVWILVAFCVPALYAVNTVFISSRWPKSADAIQVAHAQAALLSGAVLFGNLSMGSLDALWLASRNAPAVLTITLSEGLAVLVYLKIARNFGASFVSLANYVSMVFAAILGSLFFGDQLTWLSVTAAALLVLALSLDHLVRRRL